MYLMQIHKKHNMESKEKFVTIRINSEVHKVAKAIASLEDMGLQEYIEFLILKKIKEDYPDVFKKLLVPRRED
jgi:predicted DNA binding CopG/RHH family protein